LLHGGSGHGFAPSLFLGLEVSRALSLDLGQPLALSFLGPLARKGLVAGSLGGELACFARLLLVAKTIGLELHELFE